MRYLKAIIFAIKEVFRREWYYLRHLDERKIKKYALSFRQLFKNGVRDNEA